jgi:hypothetical protein
LLSRTICQSGLSILHDMVHLLFGVAGLLMARTFAAARGYRGRNLLELSQCQRSPTAPPC